MPIIRSQLSQPWLSGMVVTMVVGDISFHLSVFSKANGDYNNLIHVRDIIANHRPRFPWIISRNHPSNPETLRVRGDLSALELVLMLIQAPVH